MRSDTMHAMIVSPQWPILRLAADGQARIVGLTVVQYDSLIETGLLAEDPRTELIAGLIVQKDRSQFVEDPRTVGAEHAYTISRLIELAPSVKLTGALLRVQQPIALPPDHEPEPDARS
jgi:hypothetical protein